jgi:hypothetical protein
MPAWTLPTVLALSPTARHLDAGGNNQAAGVIVGHLEINYAGVIKHPIMRRRRASRSLQEISAMSDPEWKAKGAAMTRTEWVDYTLNALPSH